MARPPISIMTAAPLIGLALVSQVRGQETPKADAIRESVVKVFTTMRLPDPVRPWQKGSSQEATGTGVVIEGKRILTNAHVVTYASQVFVQAEGSGDKVAASVEAISPDIDLAVLKIEDDPAFFNGRPPLIRTEGLPEIKESVLVYGYPTGGSGSR